MIGIILAILTLIVFWTIPNFDDPTPTKKAVQISLWVIGWTFYFAFVGWLGLKLHGMIP